MLRELKRTFLGSFDDPGDAREARNGCAQTLRNMRLTRRYLVAAKPAHADGVGRWYEVWLYEYEATDPAMRGVVIE